MFLLEPCGLGALSVRVGADLPFMEPDLAIARVMEQRCH
jgi:hypothetical protein